MTFQSVPEQTVDEVWQEANGSVTSQLPLAPSAVTLTVYVPGVHRPFAGRNVT
jgi:hypothetical protein